MKAATIAFAVAPVLAGLALRRSASNDVQIAVAANQVDINAGEFAETKGSSPDVKGEANISLSKLTIAIALMACAGIGHAQQMQEVIRATVNKMAEKPSDTVTTPAEPQPFGRGSVYATEPPNPSNPVFAGGLTVDEAGGAPLYATELTHPSGPVMVGGNELQPYGRSSVYVAGSPAHVQLSRITMAQRG